MIRAGLMAVIGFAALAGCTGQASDRDLVGRVNTPLPPVTEPGLHISGDVRVGVSTRN